MPTEQSSSAIQCGWPHTPHTTPPGSLCGLWSAPISALRDPGPAHAGPSTWRPPASVSGLLHQYKPPPSGLLTFPWSTQGAPGKRVLPSCSSLHASLMSRTRALRKPSSRCRPCAHRRQLGNTCTAVCGGASLLCVRSLSYLIFHSVILEDPFLTSPQPATTSPTGRGPQGLRPPWLLASFSANLAHSLQQPRIAPSLPAAFSPAWGHGRQGGRSLARMVAASTTRQGDGAGAAFPGGGCTVWVGKGRQGHTGKAPGEPEQKHGLTIGRGSGSWGPRSR